METQRYRPTCKIVAQHYGTKKRFIYGTCGQFTPRDFYGEEFNPTPIPFNLASGTGRVNRVLARYQREKPDFRIFAEWD